MRKRMNPVVVALISAFPILACNNSPPPAAAGGNADTKSASPAPAPASPAPAPASSGSGAGIARSECSSYAKCGVGQQPCKSGGCFKIGECDHAICIEQKDACQKMCGVPTCHVLESYPMKIRCN